MTSAIDTASSTSLQLSSPRLLVSRRSVRNESRLIPIRCEASGSS